MCACGETPETAYAKQESDKLAAAQAEIDRLKDLHDKDAVIVDITELLKMARESFHAIILHGQHPSHDRVWAAYTLNMANKALQALGARND